MDERFPLHFIPPRILGPRGSDEAAKIHRSGYSSLAWSAHFPQHVAVLFEIETRDRLWSGGLQLNLIPLSECGPIEREGRHPHSAGACPRELL